MVQRVNMMVPRNSFVGSFSFAKKATIRIPNRRKLLLSLGLHQRERHCAGLGANIQCPAERTWIAIAVLW